MATKYKRGRCWYLQWTEEGKQQRHSLGAITEADAKARRVALERERAGVRAVAGPVFAQWAVEYATWHSHEYPDNYYRIEQIIRMHLIPAFGTLPLGAIHRREVEAYKHARLVAGATPGTVSKELRTLQAMINRAVAWEVIPHNPIRGVNPPRDLSSKPPRWYTAQELELIYAADPIHWDIWRLLANTGMRRGEALQLPWRHVGKQEIRVLSEPTARTKSGKWRLIPVSEGAQDALERLKGSTGKTRFVLPQVAPTSVSRAFDKALERVRLDGSLHCLRHTYCSHLIMMGVSLRTVQVLAGHAHASTTERYAHLAPGHLQDSVKGLRL
jgi:integrase